MNEENVGNVQKVINGSLRQIKNSLADLQIILNKHDVIINRIEEPGPSTVCKSDLPNVSKWDDLNLTNKIREIEQTVGLITSQFESVTKRLDSLV
jgi:hypothetical protein